MSSANFTDISTSYLEVKAPVVGAALNIPQAFIPPGSANIYQCFVGAGMNKIVNAALNVMANTTNPIAIDVVGPSNLTGVVTIVGATSVNGATRIDGPTLDVVSVTTTVNSTKTAISGSKGLTFNGNNVLMNGSNRVDISSPNINLNGNVIIAGVGNLPLALNSKKTFDIKHPNKPNYRLRHACVEGPEAAIYVRGKLLNSNVITLPDYWDGLVDKESITVNLTQIGHSQDLYVEKIEWGKNIIVKSGNGTTINCHYQIWADRLGKMIIEYEGATPDDYPGDNSEYSIAGWTYDKK
tara:strand:+ start:2211 stop:3098 length:888 start_codon:yes stop_codon:yes gene_type:complete